MNRLQTVLGIDLYRKVQNIQIELKKNHIKVRNTDLHNYISKMVDERIVIETFKKNKKKKIDELVNNPLWDFKW